MPPILTKAQFLFAFWSTVISFAGMLVFVFSWQWLMN